MGRPKGSTNKAKQVAVADKPPAKRSKPKAAPVIGPAYAVSYLALASIMQSPTNPRKYLDEAQLEDLTESIREKGVLEPIIVRVEGKEFIREPARYELVAGERRWRASKAAGLDEIPAIVRQLTDEEVLDIQIHENLHRADVHPLDEAIGYQYLLNAVPGLTIVELARRVVKSEEYVHRRLRLNTLVDEAKEDFWKGLISLGHALEIARLDPAVQLPALGLCYRGDWNYKKQRNEPNKERPLTVAHLVSRINQEILLNLKQAPFKLDDPKLREDGLTCIECPQRSGYNPVLFADIKDADTCTNPVCYSGKAAAMIQLTRAKVTTSAMKKGKPDTYVAPVVLTEWNAKPDKEKGEVGRDDYRTARNATACTSTETAVYGDEGQVGKTGFICRDRTCKVHWGNSSSGSSGNSGKKDPEVFGRRKQEINDIKVNEAVRRHVFYQLADKFKDEDWDRYAGAVGELWAERILRRFWDRVESHTSQVLAMLLFDVKYGRVPANLTKAQKMQILILSSVGHWGENQYGNNYVDQGDVIELAKEYEIDYQMLDAKERLAIVPKKHRWDAERYLADLDAGKRDSPKPEVWCSPAQVKRQAALAKQSKAAKATA
ncbi:MAG: ParB/RepB/Spo0J family partition protein [Pyrinomonadaceae bacterium]